MISPALFFTFIVLTIAGPADVHGGVHGLLRRRVDAGAEAPDAALMNVVYLFRQAFEFFNMGFASAMAWLLFAIIMIVTAIQFVVSRRFVFYQGDSQDERGRAGEPAHRRRGDADAARAAGTGVTRRGPASRSAARFGRLKSVAVRDPARPGISVLALYPFVWLVSASLKPQGDVFDNKLIPDQWQWNYTGDPTPVPGDEKLFALPDVPVLHVGLEQRLDRAARRRRSSRSRARSSPSRFAYFRFPGRNFLFALILATMMLPGAVTMIPVYLIWNELSKLTAEAARSPSCRTSASTRSTRSGCRTSSAAPSTSSCYASSSSASRATSSRPRGSTATATSRCSGGSRCRSRSRR